MLWSPPAAEGDRIELRSTAENVIAFARLLNPAVAAASLDFDAAVHKIGTEVMADPTLILEACPSSVFQSERRYRAVQPDPLKLKVELRSKYAELERLAGGSL